SGNSRRIEPDEPPATALVITDFDFWNGRELERDTGAASSRAAFRFHVARPARGCPLFARRRGLHPRYWRFRPRCRREPDALSDHTPGFHPQSDGLGDGSQSASWYKPGNF